MASMGILLLLGILPPLLVNVDLVPHRVHDLERPKEEKNVEVPAERIDTEKEIVEKNVRKIKTSEVILPRPLPLVETESTENPIANHTGTWLIHVKSRYAYTQILTKWVKSLRHHVGFVITQKTKIRRTLAT